MKNIVIRIKKYSDKYGFALDYREFNFDLKHPLIECIIRFNNDKFGFLRDNAKQYSSLKDAQIDCEKILLSEYDKIISDEDAKTLELLI